MPQVRPFGVAAMGNFDAGSFSDISTTTLGKKLWSFLNERETFVRMETATLLRRPALEAVQLHLLERFGDEIRVDRWKQMTGRMARQVMERHDYILDRTGVRISRGSLFTSAARYKTVNAKEGRT